MPFLPQAASREYASFLCNRCRWLGCLSLDKLNFKLNCRLERVEKTEAGLVLHFADGKTMETDVVLWALGRVPNVEGLGLEHLREVSA